MTSDTHHTVSPSLSHTHIIIFLHGRDITVKQFEKDLFESQASDERYLTQIFPHLRWVFPQSNIRPFACFGENLSQWFDMWSTEEPHVRKEIRLDGLQESSLFIQQVIDAESKLVPLSHIFLCGISQGCATALSTLLCGRKTLGGFIGFCGWMPYGDEIELSTDKPAALRQMQARLDKDATNASQATRPDIGTKALATPVFLSHSRDDNVVPVQCGLAMSKALREIGMQVTWKEYQDGGHWIQEPQGIDDLVDFMMSVMEEDP
ncbi:MAG: hypothetical protein M1822_002650 [Bathelium mastoideum]|nr:MAG: hypothetical protein M1822_002650 [Bathelium mastoideum]